VMAPFRRGALALGLFCLLAISSPARASDADLCNQLASEDASRAPVVALQTVDPQQAQTACAAAVAADPANPALIHQYARALERAGRLEDARRLYDWAAGDGYAPAVAAQARLAAIEPKTDTGWTDDSRAQLGDAMAGISSSLTRFAGMLPPDPADPLAVLAETGTEPKAILAWVSAHTRLVAYSGSLRGPKGVLTDRSGNSLDRALLLSMLLSQAGQQVRLAKTSLGDAEVERLLPATQRVVDVPGRQPLSRAEVLALLSDQRIGQNVVERAVADAAERKARTHSLLDERTQLLLPVLTATAQTAAEAADQAARQADLAALHDYFWVQVRAGNGWIDLAPEADLVGVLVPSETFDPAALPEALRQSVTLRVILELQDKSARHEANLLTWTGYPADLGDRVLTLSHEARGLDAIGQVVATPNAKERVLGLVDGVTAWTVILRLVTLPTTCVRGCCGRSG